jgi:hypothetical protein
MSAFAIDKPAALGNMQPSSVMTKTYLPHPRRANKGLRE